MTKLLGLLVLPALVGVLLVAPPTADAARAARAAEPTKVIGDCQHPAFEPKKIIAACADFNAFAVVKHYDSWTRHQARGSGRLAMNDCKPDCASGHVHRYPATFSLHKVVTKQDGTRLFSKLGVTYYKHGQPHDITFLLPTISVIVG